MSIDTFNGVPDTARAGLNDEVSFSSLDNSETSTGHAMLHLDSFDCSGAKFDFPPAGFYSNDGGDSGEKTPCAPPVDLAPLADGDQTFSFWPDSSTPSDHSPFPCDYTPPSSITSCSQDPCSDHCSSEEPITDLCGGDPRPLDPHTTRRESTQPRSAPAGWTYRQILEVVAFPPPEGQHLWHAKVSQLAADLGMPSWATGRDIVTFVQHVASVKNELDKVAPLIKALATAARVLEGRVVAPTVLLPVIFALYPSIAALCSPEPVQADTNTARKRSHDEMTSESESDEEEEKDWEYDGDDDDADDTDDTEPTSRRPRLTEEEDLYCRVGDCLWAFKDSRMCTKHRYRHFSVSWICPGPCRGPAQEAAKFTRSDTLRRHLLQKNTSCMEAVLKVLNLETIPGSGSIWLEPFRDGPERPWESADFQLTDLSIVKDVKMKLRSSGYAALPDMHTNRRRRYK